MKGTLSFYFSTFIIFASHLQGIAQDPKTLKFFFKCFIVSASWFRSHFNLESLTGIKDLHSVSYLFYLRNDPVYYRF